MGVNLFRPTDENGAPRRFRGHGEAFVWVAGTLIRMCGPRLLWGSVYAMVAWAAWTVARSVYPGFAPGLFPAGWSWIFVVVAAFAILVTLLIFGSVLIYLYLVLAGGVMRGDERGQAGR